jgi:hypothetical protein
MSEGAPKDVTKTGEEPTKIIEINGQKLEMGPDLGEMQWTEISGNLDRLNLGLKSNEKRFRLPTAEEFRELGKPILVIQKEEQLTSYGKEDKIKEYIESVGLSVDKFYWSSTEGTDKELVYVEHFNDRYDGSWSFNAKYVADRIFKGTDSSRKNTVQCVREV